MQMLALQIHPIMHVVAVLFVITAIVLILVVLIQKGRGGGLSGALGGMGSGGVLGTKTGDFLTWVTIGLACFFLVLAVLMAKFYKPRDLTLESGPAAQDTTLPQAEPTPGADETLPPMPEETTDPDASDSTDGNTPP